MESLFSRPTLDQLESACLEGGVAYHKGIWQHPYLGEWEWAWDLGWRDTEFLDGVKREQFDKRMAVRAELAKAWMGRARA